MRTIVLFAALTTHLARTCGASDAPPPPPPQTGVAAGAQVQAQAEVTVQPRHGGSIIAARDYNVEVVPHADGAVVAYVVQGSGAALAPDGLSLTVDVKGIDGAVHPVAMAWDPGALYFEGKLTGVVPAPGPVSIALTTPSGAIEGSGAIVLVQPADPTIVVQVPDTHVEVRGPRVNVHAPRVNVEVVQPRVAVRVAQPVVAVRVAPPVVAVHVAVPAPPPPPAVRVQIGLPRPPTLRVEGHASAGISAH